MSEEKRVNTEGELLDFALGAIKLNSAFAKNESNVNGDMVLQQMVEKGELSTVELLKVQDIMNDILNHTTTNEVVVPSEAPPEESTESAEETPEPSGDVNYTKPRKRGKTH